MQYTRHCLVLTAALNPEQNQNTSWYCSCLRTTEVMKLHVFISDSFCHMYRDETFIFTFIKQFNRSE